MRTLIDRLRLFWCELGYQNRDPWNVSEARAWRRLIRMRRAALSADTTKAPEEH